MKRTLFGIACLIAFVPLTSQAATAYLVTTIVRTLVDSSYFGGCMAQLAAPPASVGLDCATSWVTFSCTGELSAKDIAYRKFDAAQLAFVQSRRVYLIVDDAQSHNGHCFARRIDLLQ